MADNTTLNTGTGGDVIATDDISGVKYQRVKIVQGADGVNDGDVSSTNPLPIDGTVTIGGTVAVTDNSGSLTVDGTVTANQPASTAYRVVISDGTSDVPIDAAHSDGETNTENHIDVGAKLLVFNGTNWDRQRGNATDGILVNLGTNNDVTITGSVAVTDNGSSLTIDGTVTANAGTGTFVVGDGGSSLTVDGTVSATQSGTWILGSNSGVDIGDVTINNTGGASAVNIQDGGNSITVDGTVSVTDGLNIEGDVAHDSIDSGNPVKIGFKAASTLPTGVATGDRVDAVADLYGRQLVTNIDDGMQVWKGANYTTQQTGTDIWTPSGGKRIAITYIAISSYATTTGRVILWFGASGDTTYTAGTDQLVWAGSFAPSANAKPGAIISVPFSIAAVTADHRLKITTDAAISLDLTIYGYEH